MNQEELKQMLNAAYELEGLLEMALRRDLSENHSIYQLIANKSYLIANMATEWNLTENSQSSAGELCSEDDKVIDLFVNNCLPKETSEFRAEIVADMQDDIASDEEPIIQNSYKDDIIESEKCEDEIVANDVYEEVDNIKDVSRFDEVQVDEFDEMDDADDYEIVEDEEAPQVAESFKEIEHNEIILDRKDIRTLFTINDKFRFKRELFGNNNVEFSESLNLVQTMDSYEEAEDYFYNDLQWDKESEDVMEFMAIIARFFR